MKHFFLALACGSAAAATCLPFVAFAQDNFPAKPIRLVVPLPPGGGADGLARIWGDYVARHLGTTVVVENRAGANGSASKEMPSARSRRLVPLGSRFMVTAVITSAWTRSSRRCAKPVPI